MHGIERHCKNSLVLVAAVPGTVVQLRLLRIADYRTIDPQLALS